MDRNIGQKLTKYGQKSEMDTNRTTIKKRMRLLERQMEIDHSWGSIVFKSKCKATKENKSPH